MSTSTPSKQPNRNDRRPRHRRWLPYLGAVILLALIVIGMWPKPAPVEIARVSVGKLRTSVNEEGKTRIRQRYVVSAPVNGQLRRIPFKAGADIESTNTVVAVIDPVNPALLDARTRVLAEARRDSATAQLERAKVQHQFASSELRRNEQLFKEQTISAQEWEQVQLNEAAAAREATAAAAALRQAEAELLEFTNVSSTGTNRPPVEVRAPVAGKVLKVYEESARAVAAGTPLVEIGDPHDIDVIIEALSRDGATINAGTPVELEQWGGPVPLQAKVRYVEPAAFTKVSALGVEEQRVYVVADILTPVAERGSLGDNFRVEARIITWKTDNALKVPNGAVFRNGDQWHAYVVEGGVAKLRPVKVGHANNTETEILDGLKEGEEVILYPGDRIKEDVRVESVKF